MEIRRHPSALDRLEVTAPEYPAEFEVWGQCPVQATGTVRGKDLYFRARQNKWEFDIANDAGGMPSDGSNGENGFYREGRYPEAGWMPLNEAVKIIVGCLDEYAAGHDHDEPTTDCPA